MVQSIKDRVKALGDITVAKQPIKLDAYTNLFVHEFKRSDGHKPGIRSRIPSPQAWLYVRYLFEGLSRTAAHEKAGYKCLPGYRQSVANNFHNKRHIQILINAVMGEYIAKRQLSAQVILDKALVLYDRCDTVREQLEVLKFINNLMPKGTVKCGARNCPIRRTRKK